jgi:hypothetical protein
MAVTKGDKTPDGVHLLQNQAEQTLNTATPARLVHYPVPMELTFYCASDPTVRFNDVQNRGIEVVRGLLEKLERRGVKVRTIDPRTLSSEQLLDAYAQATIPAICKKYDVKTMFGTQQHSACWFGCQVPALLLKQTSDDIGDTYPHRTAENVVVTICEFVTGALAALQSSGAGNTLSGPRPLVPAQSKAEEDRSVRPGTRR